ncbi:MAG TPA: Holliday junction branch migration DNA helicase RuvB [Anaerolineales bacterium]|jgi:Holliday junction DNA helicase RuvB|nr:Holliday junction branch migration DNA helicase RuvB [Anaerolineales bacterium]
MTTDTPKGRPRPLDPESKPDDRVDNALRPQKLSDLIGQNQVKENLAILIGAARKRGESLDHVLFYGPPGLGKTTLAHVLGNEMGVNVKVTAGPAIERAGDLAAILTNLRAGDVLFIDEVHRLGRAVEEVLYPAMEDFALDIVIGKGPSARSIRLKLPRFTVVGATTRLALVTAPLRARFGAVYRLDYYDLEAMKSIVQRAASMLKVEVEPGGVEEIGRRARGTPRVALRLLRRVRDYAQVRADGRITAEIAREALDLLQVDPLGLDDIDRRVLKTIIQKYGGGPVGLNTIAASISEEQDTIMDVVEPYLLQLGFLDRTAQGRIATKSAYKHLKMDWKEEGQQRLL